MPESKSVIPPWNKPARPVQVEELRAFAAQSGNDVNVLVTWTSETNSYQLTTVGSNRYYADAAARCRDFIAQRMGLTLGKMMEDRRDDHPDQRPKIICICGSSRFVADIAVKAWELEKRGYIALGIHLLPSWYHGLQPDHQAEHENVAAILDHIHFAKIDLADAIFVMNVDGYIGERTRLEIEHAEAIGKPIEYLIPNEPTPEQS